MSLLVVCLYKKLDFLICSSSSLSTDCMLFSCSLCGISDAVYCALNGDAIPDSFSSLNVQTISSAGLFAALRCLIPKQRHCFNKLLELALISKCIDVYSRC